MRVIIFFTILYVILSIYGFFAIKTLTKNPWFHYIFIGIALLILGNFIIQFSMGSEGRVLSPAKSYAFGFFLSFFLFSAALVIFLLGEDMVRLGVGTYEKFFGQKQTFHLPSRRKFISTIALGVAAVPFVSMLYGMYRGKYNFRVLKYTLHFEDLPEAFDGYRLTQISDIHSGSFDNHEKIEYGVNLISEQNSDVILFTGDMVNNKSSEMLPWKSLFWST